MAQIPPITDAYIDEVIKAQQAYNPGLNKTQGVKMRELVKLLRDRLEQEAGGGGQVNVQQATESMMGIAKVATHVQALEKLSDTEMMTPVKTGVLINDEKKWFKFQVAMTGETEQAILMEYSGQIDSSLLAGCNALKLKIGVDGVYPSDVQVLPFCF